MLGVATGARMSALLELTWAKVKFPGAAQGGGPVDETQAFITVNERPSCVDGVDFDLEMIEPMMLDFGAGHGNKRRPSGTLGKMNPGLYDALVDAWKRRGNSAHVIEYRGRKVGRVDLRDSYVRAGLPVPNDPHHILKHTCCTWLVQDGVPFQTIAKLVGTTAATIEKHYGHQSTEMLAAAGKSLVVKVDPCGLTKREREFLQKVPTRR